MWIWKLTREFATFPDKSLRRELLHARPTFEGLKQAQEKTKKLRDRGWLRPSTSASRLLRNAKVDSVPKVDRLPPGCSDSDVFKFIWRKASEQRRRAWHR
jgi:hypothetical protein